MKFYIETPGPLQELELGRWITVNGEPRRVTSMATCEATEDDPDLGVMAGDIVTTVTFHVMSAVGSAVSEAESGGDERIRTAE